MVSRTTESKLEVGIWRNIYSAESVLECLEIISDQSVRIGVKFIFTDTPLMVPSNRVPIIHNCHISKISWNRFVLYFSIFAFIQNFFYVRTSWNLRE